MSICSPHLGIRAPSRKILRSWMHAVSHMTGLSDRQLTYEDSKNGSEPLLAEMADPTKEFYKALDAFKTRICMGVSEYDS